MKFRLQNKEKYVFVSVLACFLLYSYNIQGQDNIKKTTDALFHFGIVDYDAEYYQVDSRAGFLEHHITYQPFLSDVNVLIMEFGIVNSFQQEGNFTTPGDSKITFRRNLLSGQYGNSGYQGVTAGLQLIMPTGSDDYYSGFDSWSIEPIIGTAWRFSKSVWSHGIQAKYNYSFAALPTKSPRFSFLRAEYYFGYESTKQGFYFESDYRYIPSRYNHNLLLKISYNINANSNLGFKTSYKYRVLGNEFYEYLLTVGFYLFLG